MKKSIGRFVTILVLLFPICSFGQMWTSTLLPGADFARGVNAIVTDGTDVYAFLLDGPDTIRFEAGIDGNSGSL